MKLRNAFSMLELIFVIVIMGIIGKFGTEFLAESYKSFIFSNVNNTLQSNSATAIEFIASRLQYRIRDSIIARESGGTFVALSDVDSGKDYPVLEWVQTGIDSFRGTDKPYWSGIIDLDAGDKSHLVSPGTDTTLVDEMIKQLSYYDEDTGEGSTINDAALYFIGSNSDINGYGWNGAAITTQDNVMHPINSNANINEFVSGNGDDFSGTDIYEYYKLSWSANAIVMEEYDDDDDTTTNMGDLYFYYDYQPWNGQNYKDNGKKALIMKNVSTFRAIALGSVIKIQVCVKSNLVEEYALCKEKTIF